MKFITIRELRNSSKNLKAMLKKSDKLVLTSNGKPIALLTPVGEETLEQELMTLRRAKALAALERVRGQAREKGFDRLSLDEINRIISRSRKPRRGSPVKK